MFSINNKIVKSKLQRALSSSMDFPPNQEMDQIPGTRLQDNPSDLFWGSQGEGRRGEAPAPARICVSVKTNNPVNNEPLVLSPPRSSYWVSQMFCWLKIDPFQNLINRIGFFHMLSRQMLTTKTKPVINPWTPMTWTWLGSATVNYSVVQEQYP